MKGFGMLWRESERLPVGGFRFGQTAGLLMPASLLKPNLDRRRRALFSCGFLTASLGSIHDASAAEREGSRKDCSRSKALEAYR